MNALPPPTERKKTGGMMPKRKGYEHERHFVNFMRDGGVECRRVPLSGAGIEKDDVVVTLSTRELRGEGKRRASLPGWLSKALHGCHFAFLREDRGETFILLPIELFRDLCNGR